MKKTMENKSYYILANNAINASRALNRDKDNVNFKQRVKVGKLWEKVFVKYLEENYKDPTAKFIISKGQNKEYDVKIVGKNKNKYCEVKSDYTSNESGKIYIKALQYNIKNNEWENASLYSGDDSIYWIQYLQHNDEWFMFVSKKGELKAICKKYPLVTINVDHQHKAPSKGYIIPIDEFKGDLKPVL